MLTSVKNRQGLYGWDGGLFLPGNFLDLQNVDKEKQVNPFDQK